MKRLRQPKAKAAVPAVAQELNVTKSHAVAKMALDPTVQAALTVNAFARDTDADIDLVGLLNELTEQARTASTGDLARGEAMLVSQAHTLDAIFHSCARRATTAGHMTAYEPYLRLAMRAQSQARMTWETLALMKNPPNVAFVQQANIAHGPQQVNNGVETNPASRARETTNEQSKLLEVTHGERLDTGATGTAGRSDTHLEAVGAINRSKDTQG